MADLRTAVEELSQGFRGDGFTLRARGKFQGRLAEEENMDVYVGETRLLSAKFFYGRKPYYHPWVELFTINPQFFNSRYEGPLIKLLSDNLGSGGRLFVEYEEDDETREGLVSGFPAPSTRLGCILFQNGFTWFKDWYFAEGFYEGDIKLQGEKASDRNSQKRHTAEIQKELQEFLGASPKGPLAEKALSRAREILEHLK